MIIYLLVFVIALIYLYNADKFGKTKSSGLLLTFLLSLAFFIGLGDMIGGYDRYIYGEIFDGTYDHRVANWSVPKILYSEGSFSEKGYMLLNYLLSFLTANRYVFILLVTIIMYVMYYYAIKKYAIHYPLACIVFLGFFYYFTATYIRQCLAVGVIWLSVNYILKRDFFRFILMVLLAGSFHNSAYVFFPMYFICRMRFSMKTVWIFLFVCFILGLTPLPVSLMAFTGETAGLEGRVSQYVEDGFGGVRYDYLLEVVFFLWVLYKNRKAMPTDMKSLVFLNLFYAFCGLLLFFIKMGQGGRFGWYFMIGIIYILSFLSLQHRIIKDMKLFVIFLSFVLFYRITDAWAFNLTPYKTFFTNGYPSGDSYIYEKYEYDGKYKNDKFYRDPWVLW